MQFNPEYHNPDYYAVLGVSPDATVWEIRKAYFRLAFHYHFDDARYSDIVGRFGDIEEAYYVLGNRSRRAAYDLSRYAPSLPPQIAAPGRPRRWRGAVISLLAGSVYGWIIGGLVGRITGARSGVAALLAIVLAILMAVFTPVIVLGQDALLHIAVTVVHFAQARPEEKEVLLFGLLGVITGSTVGLLAAAILLEKGVIWIVAAAIGGIVAGYLGGLMITRVLLRRLFGRAQTPQSQ